jgi:hypothetical protein
MKNVLLTTSLAAGALASAALGLAGIAKALSRCRARGNWENP